MALFSIVQKHAAGSVAAYDQGHTKDSPLPAQLSYGELREAARRLSNALAARLTALGAGAGSDGEATVATCMRRGNEWYSVFVAAARLHAPVVAMSTDLPDKAAECARNAEILTQHRPALLVVDSAEGLRAALEGAADAPAPACAVVSFKELWAEAKVAPDVDVPSGWWIRSATEARPEDATLCFNYTGGTTEASRCVWVTHGMALHEVRAYPSVVSMSSSDRVLQQHSLYWAASAYGELDIALAFGCAVVFCTAWGADGVVSAIRETGATCAGLVPSILAALDHADVPSLRVVFTWGEALQARAAREWSRKVQLIDLLISTECWLSLYADWTAFCRDGGSWAAAEASIGDADRPAFRTVEGAKVQLRALVSEDSSPNFLSDSAGELLVSGPMVSPGYTDVQRTAAAFVVEDGVRWYCTRDCLEPRSGGYAFAGRADDMIKVGGAWVDVRDIERRLELIDGVSQARIFRRDAFVVLQPGSSGALPLLRRALPADFSLFAVPHMPLRPGTEKVDRKRLAQLVDPGLEEAHCGINAAALADELSELQFWYLPLCLLLLLPLVHLVQSICAAGSATDVAIQVLVATPTELLARCLCLSYLLLAPMYWSSLRLEAQNFPLGHIGFLLALAAFLPGVVCLTIVAAPWAYRALQRDRLFSWPVLCAVAFPLWAQQCGSWWVNRGLRVVLKWYWRLLRQAAAGAASRLSRGARGAAAGAAAKVRRRCGWARQCKECKKMVSTSKGHSDPKIDDHWYCEECWTMYNDHQQCRMCKQWRTQGQEDAEIGGWICSRCSRQQSQKRQQQREEEQQLLQKEQGWRPDASTEAASPSPSPSSPSSSPSDAAAAGAGRSSAEPSPSSASSAGAGDGAGRSGAEQSPSAASFSGAGAGAGAGAGGAAWSGAWPKEGGYGGAGGSGGGGWAKHYGAMHQPYNGDARHNSNGSAPVRRYVEHRVVAVTPPPPLLPAPSCGSGVGERGANAKATEEGATDGAAAAEAKSPEWLLIEKATGWTFASSGDAIDGLDSLRTTKMASALRRAAGVRLARGQIKACKTLGDLLAEISHLLPEDHEAAALANGGAKNGSPRPPAEHKAWGMMWNSKCQWTLRRERPLAEEDLREALKRLVERHEALRSEFKDPMDMFSSVQKALSVFELWRIRERLPLPRRRRMVGGRFLQPLFHALERLVCCAIEAAWPRLQTKPKFDGEMPLAVLARKEDAQEAKSSLWTAPDFVPPLQVVLVQYGHPGTESEGALVHVIISHMLSDGYSIVPLLADIAELVAQAEAARAAKDGAPKMTPLPTLPSSLDNLEKRIVRTVFHDNTFRDLITLEATNSRGWGAHRVPATTFATLPAELVVAIRRVARQLAVTDEIIMLAALGTSLARFNKEETPAISMVVPQRDLPGESDMVGLFADVRILSVRTAGLSFVGTVLQLQHVVKERLWHPPPLMALTNFPFINFEWTDFDSRHGFQQDPFIKRGQEVLQNPLKVAVDQPDEATWRMRVAFDTNTYSDSDRTRFFTEFEDCLRSLLEDPLALVWGKKPEEHTGGAAAE